MNRDSKHFRWITSILVVSPAEATIAWFLSGKKQEIVSSIFRIGVYADCDYDCTQEIQAAIDFGSYVNIPKGTMQISSSIDIKGVL